MPNVLEESIFAHLSTVAALTTHVSTRIYPMMMPQNVTLPAISYQRISNAPQYSMSGPCGMDNPRIQVDVWTTGYGAAKAIGDQVRKAMNTATAFKAVQLSDQDMFEPDLEIYRVSMDFSCWFAST
jgi:hypothetical protein